MTQNHGPQIKDDAAYEAMRDEGYSKEKAARIANANAANDHDSSRRGGEHAAYEAWTKDELYDKAKQVGIEGRSKMDKQQLIDALRNH